MSAKEEHAATRQQLRQITARTATSLGGSVGAFVAVIALCSVAGFNAEDFALRAAASGVALLAVAFVGAQALSYFAASRAEAARKRGVRPVQRGPRDERQALLGRLTEELVMAVSNELSSSALNPSKGQEQRG